MSVKCVPPQTPLLYSKTGVCRGIPIFLILLQNIDYGYSLEPPEKVQVGKDQEKAQSERDSHSKNRGGKKPN